MSPLDTLSARRLGFAAAALLAPWLTHTSSAWAQSDTSSAAEVVEEEAAGWGDLSDFEAEETPVFEARLYGYIDSYFEQVADTPAGVDGNGDTVFESNPYEFDVLNLHVMVQGTIYGKYRFFVNLAAPGSGGVTGDEPIAVRNAWVEAPLFDNLLVVRAGKTYRRFGLYNEILDAVPTFIGIEPPELFDKDHLMLTRTTNLMLHGTAAMSNGYALRYSVATGNDERADRSFPVGADLRLIGGGMFTLGTSFYWTGGDATPSRDVGDGSPRGGVVNWMDRDRYVVFGGYGQLQMSGVILQAAYWQANHDARRNAESTLALADGDLNQRQLERFFVNGDPMQGVVPEANYAVQTFYVRAGYELAFESGFTLIPYAQADFYKNPETVASKDLGGDAEAGITDDGQFWKVTAGAVVRPVPQVAFKVDGSAHIQQFNGESVIYPEIRLSLSYLWELLR